MGNNIDDLIKNALITGISDDLIEVEKEIKRIPSEIKSELSNLTYTMNKLIKVSEELKKNLSFNNNDILISKLISFNRVILIYNIISIFLLIIILLLTIFNK